MLICNGAETYLFSVGASGLLSTRALFFAKKLALLRKEIHKLVRGANKDFINNICDDAIYGNMSKSAWEAIKVL